MKFLALPFFATMTTFHLVAAEVPATKAPPSQPTLQEDAVLVGCFQLEPTAKAKSKNVQRLCVSQNKSDYFVEIATGDPTAGGVSVIATFSMQLRSRTRCLDCNKDVYTLGPAGSSFSRFTIAFNGKREKPIEIDTVVINPRAESGTVTIAGVKFFYHNVSLSE
jgi:hypothetical protein